MISSCLFRRGKCMLVILQRKSCPAPRMCSSIWCVERVSNDLPVSRILTTFKVALPVLSKISFSHWLRRVERWLDFVFLLIVCNYGLFITWCSRITSIVDEKRITSNLPSAKAVNGTWESCIGLWLCQCRPSAARSVQEIPRLRVESILKVVRVAKSRPGKNQSER